MPDMATNGTDPFAVEPTDDQREAEQEQVYITGYDRKVYHTDRDCPQIESEIWDTRPRELLESWGATICETCNGTDDRVNKGPQLSSALQRNDSVADALDDYHDREEQAGD
jgi:hypothetical protein